jgi:pyruvate ferredoxin oxidoreductase gamma subunit
MDILEPDCVVVLDSRLPSVVDVLKGLKREGTAILNAKEPPSKVELKFRPAKLATVDATGIALKTMGTPITNMAMLGAFAAATSWVSIESVRQAIEKRFEQEAAKHNAEAALEAYEKTLVEVS